MTPDPSKVALLYSMSKEADLSPQLGLPGGRCYVIERIEDTVRGSREREKLIQKVERGEKLSPQEEKLIYSSGHFERGPAGTQFKKILLSLHAQYRMDLRGITTNDLRLAFMGFHAEWAKAKGGKGRWKFDEWETKIQNGQQIEYTDPRTRLKIVFEVGTWKRTDRAAVLITCWWEGVGKVKPVNREDCSQWEGWAGEYPSSEFERHFQADLNPSLGYPGGPCQVIERVDSEVRNPKLRDQLVDQVEDGKELSNSQANKVYDLNAEPGPSGTRFRRLLITAHAQYRMDLRGVNVSDLKLFFKRFQKAWNDSRSVKGPEARQWESDMAWGEPIRWTDSQGLTVVFEVKDRTATLVTTFWDGIPDPRPTPEEVCALPKRVAALHRESSLKDLWLQWIVQPLDVIARNHKEFVTGPVDDAMDIIIKELAPALVKAIGEKEVDDDIDEFHAGAIQGKWDAEHGHFADAPRQETEDFREGYRWGYAHPDQLSPSKIPSDLKRQLVDEALKDFRGRVTEEVVKRALLKSWDALSPVTTFRAIVAAVKRYGWKLGLVIALVEIVETFVVPAALIAITGKPELSVVGMLPLSEILYAVVFRLLGQAPSEADKFDPDGHLDWYEGRFGPVRIAVGPRVALRMPAVPGVRTVVREDSQRDLPNDLDQESESALPLPGSASPGGAGRVVPKFEMNTPDNDIDKRPRTLSEPGEQYGNPSNNTYNTVTRRTMTSAEMAVRAVMAQMDLLAEDEDDGFDKEGYKQTWNRGKRQRRQRGRSKTKARAYYRRNKTKIKRQSKLWRRKNKTRGAFKNSEKRRRRSVRTRRGSLNEQPCPACVAELFHRSRAAGDFAPPRERGGTDGRRQREQIRKDQREDALYYKRNRAKKQRDSERHYETECKRNRRCKERREMWQEDPGFYERGRPQRDKKKAGLLTVPEIAFGIGSDMALGYVHGISPMTGMVTFEIDDDERQIWESLPVEIFMRVAAFLSDEDLDSFFELVDAEIGEEAYEDLDAEGLRECAALYDKDPDSDQFKAQCLELTGEGDLGKLSADQLDQVNDKLVLGIMEGENEPRNTSDRDDGDETIGPEFDPHLFYGEVEQEKARKDANVKHVHASLKEDRLGAMRLLAPNKKRFFWKMFNLVKMGGELSPRQLHVIRDMLTRAGFSEHTGPFAGPSMREIVMRERGEL